MPDASPFWCTRQKPFYKAGALVCMVSLFFGRWRVEGDKRGLRVRACQNSSVRTKKKTWTAFFCRVAKTASSAAQAWCKRGARAAWDVGRTGSHFFLFWSLCLPARRFVFARNKQVFRRGFVARRHACRSCHAARFVVGPLMRWFLGGGGGGGDICAALLELVLLALSGAETAIAVRSWS